MGVINRYVKPVLRPGKRAFEALKLSYLYGSVSLKTKTIRLGTTYGGFEIATEGLGESSVVYSFGIGEDVSFDLALIGQIGCTVHAFDPTPRSIEWTKTQELPWKLVVHEVGLSDKDGSELFVPPDDPRHISHSFARKDQGKWPSLELPVQKLETIVKTLGHDRIDLLKMDIEGAEYTVLDGVIASGIEIRQIAMEFHERMVGLPATRGFVQKLKRAGFQLIAVYPEAGTVTFLQQS